MMQGLYVYAENSDFNLEELLIESFDNILITDRKARIVLCSKQMRKSLGIENEDLWGKTVYDLMGEGYYANSTILEAMGKKVRVSGIVHVLPRANNEAKNIFSTSTPILDDKGQIRYVITNSRIEKTLETYLVELEKERKNLAQYQDITKYLAKLGGSMTEIVSVSPGIRKVVSFCDVISDTESLVIITGESGVGKEIVCRYIHQHSKRRDEPFIPVNCGAIPAELMESELFGYCKGAFTGANPKGSAGLFELANHGTIFLDEIGELPIQLQSKLLRVIETNEVKRLGDSKYTNVDVRIIAATNRDLRQMVRERKFREDLFYRLNVIPVHVPPLRERKEDILPLAELFLSQFNRKYNMRKRLTESTRERFLSYDWPGNVRELRNVIERLVLVSENEEIDYSIGGRERQAADERAPSAGAEDSAVPRSLRDALEEFEREYIDDAIRRCGGNMTRASEILGIHRTHLYKKIRKARAGASGSADAV